MRFLWKLFKFFFILLIIGVLIDIWVYCVLGIDLIATLVVIFLIWLIAKIL